jgi:hypothetical protein
VPSVWSAFVDAMEDFVREVGLGRILIGLAAVAGALAGLGLAFDEAVLFTGAGAWIIVVLLVTVIAQYINRRQLRTSVSRLRRVADRYAKELVQRQHASSFTIDDWSEVVTVGKGGDTVFEKYFKLAVGDESLDTFWHRQYRHEPCRDPGYKTKVQVEARSFAEDTTGRVPGTRYLVTETWEGDSLRIFVHLDEAKDPGTTFGVYLRVRWPGYHEDLIEDHEVSRVEWTFLRQTNRVSLQMTFAENLRLNQRFAVDPIGNRGTPQQELGENGLVLTYVCADPPVSSLIGFRLERPR